MSARMTSVPGQPQREFEADTKNRNAMTTGSESQSPETSMQEDIARLAYTLWQSHGCPEGSAEADWFEAEQELRRSAEHRSSSVSRR